MPEVQRILAFITPSSEQIILKVILLPGGPTAPHPQESDHFLKVSKEMKFCRSVHPYEVQNLNALRQATLHIQRDISD
jgi:hypothetical protein